MDVVVCGAKLKTINHDNLDGSGKCYNEEEKVRQFLPVQRWM